MKEGSENWAHSEVGANSRGNRQGRGPEEGMHLAGVRNGQVSMAEGECAGREEKGRTLGRWNGWGLWGIGEF